MVVKTIKYIATSALFRLGKNTQGKEYTWMEQVAIDYLSEKAPLDGNVSLKCMYVNLGDTARVVAVPPDCMRISKIGLKSGNRVWTLTVDNNLAIPENIFQCETDQDVSNDYAAWGSGYGYGNSWWNNAPQYTLGGGQNVNYYRLVNDGGQRLIIFDHNIGDGQLAIEYMSNGSDISGDTMIDVTYAEPFREYLMAEYCIHKGTREEKQKYATFAMRHEAAQWNANILAHADRMPEMIDGMAQSTEFNLG